jgi:glycosyltransferase involved in cell wall biosynthesis
VLHLVPELGHGGPERVLYDMLSRLDRQLFAVTVAATGGPAHPVVRARFERAGLRTIVLPFDFGRHDWRDRGHGRLHQKWRALRQMAAYLRATRPQIVHTHGPLHNFYGVAAARLAGVPHIMTHDHNPMLEGWRERLAVNLATPRVDIVFAESSTVGDTRRTLLRSGSERILRLPAGVDLLDFHPPTSSERALARSEFRLPEEGFVVGAVGRLVPAKRHDLTLEAFHTLLSQVPGAHLLLLGEGSEADALRRQAQRLGIGERVHVHGWIEAIERAFWALDVFVTLSDAREGFGVRVSEAMACGLPIVARQSPLYEEILGSRVAHLVLPRPELVAASLASLERSPTERERIGLLSRQHAARQFDIDIGAHLLEDVYAHCVARTPRPWGFREELMQAQ